MAGGDEGRRWTWALTCCLWREGLESRIGTVLGPWHRGDGSLELLDSPLLGVITAAPARAEARFGRAMF